MPGEGPPRHQLLASELPPEVAADLLRELRIRRDSRMTVARMADLAPVDLYDERRGIGANYLVFAYGTWVHVEPRGLLFGARYVPESLGQDARERIQPDAILDFESGLTSEGNAGAGRTLGWIYAVEEWRAGGQRYAAENWAAHVAGLANEVLKPETHEDVRLASTLMLSLLVDPDRVEPLRESGVEPLRTAGAATWIGEVARFLAASSHGPVASSFLDEHVDAVSACLGRVFARGLDGWDVQPIREER